VRIPLGERLELRVIDQLLPAAGPVNQVDAVWERSVPQSQQHAPERDDARVARDEDQVRLPGLRQLEVAQGAGDGDRIAHLPLEEVLRSQSTGHPIEAEGQRPGRIGRASERVGADQWRLLADRKMERDPLPRLERERRLRSVQHDLLHLRREKLDPLDCRGLRLGRHGSGVQAFGRSGVQAFVVNQERRSLTLPFLNA